jgi:hypothetical protein
LVNAPPRISQRGRRSEEPPRPSTAVDVLSGARRIAMELDGPQHATDAVADRRDWRKHRAGWASTPASRCHAPDESMLGAASALFDASHGGLPAEV